MDIEELSSRIIIIDKGKMLYDGNVKHIKETYGYMSDIEILASSSINPEEVQFIKALDEEFISFQAEENRLKVQFNKNHTSTTEITKRLMGKLDITDFTIHEPSIEDIVKKIYRNEV
jgi:ABC-2 type transport system ATP-binding protein